MGTTKNIILNLKKKLESEKERLISQIATIQKEDPFLDPDHASDNAAVDTDIREQIGHETVAAEVKDLKKRLDLIDIALGKIERNDDYGICERCGIQIPEARLQVVPEARYCVDCESKLVK
jgi:DnaK suppressor protein